MSTDTLTDAQRTEIEAAVFRKLVDHLQERTDVQNIDLMNLVGFCRNCLSKWYVAAAGEAGAELEYEDIRTQVYGMPYSQWKEKFQTELTPEQKAASQSPLKGS